MHKSGATPPTQYAALFSGSNPFGGANHSSTSSTSRSRPGTSSGDPADRERPNVLIKERRPSFSKSRRRASSTGRRPSISLITSALESASHAAAVPPLPDFAIAAKLSREIDGAVPSPSSVDSFSRMLSRTNPAPVNGYASSQLAPASAAAAAVGASAAGVGGHNESSMVHQHIQEMANKRIKTLDYLRKV